MEQLHELLEQAKAQFGLRCFDNVRLDRLSEDNPAAVDLTIRRLESLGGMDGVRLAAAIRKARRHAERRPARRHHLAA